MLKFGLFSNVRTTLTIHYPTTIQKTNKREIVKSCLYQWKVRENLGQIPNKLKIILVAKSISGFICSTYSRLLVSAFTKLDRGGCTKRVTTDYGFFHRPIDSLLVVASWPDCLLILRPVPSRSLHQGLLFLLSCFLLIILLKPACEVFASMRKFDNISNPKLFRVYTFNTFKWIIKWLNAIKTFRLWLWIQSY